MFTIKRRICMHKGNNSEIIFCKSYVPFQIFSEILFFFLFFFLNTPSITKHINLELINSNLTRSYIKDEKQLQPTVGTCIHCSCLLFLQCFLGILFPFCLNSGPCVLSLPNNKILVLSKLKCLHTTT